MKLYNLIAACLLAAFMGSAQATVITVAQSALIPTTQLYTDEIGGGIGSVVVMTGGGNAAGVGNVTGRNDDGFSGPISFGFTGAGMLPFFGQNYSSFYANNNGNMSFTVGNPAYVPTGTIGAAMPLISIWFGDVDTRASTSGVLHMRQDIRNETILTWNNVGGYGVRRDFLNTFQMIVRGPDYSIPVGEGAIGFFWLDMPWGIASHTATAGLGDAAAVGFGDGAGNGMALEGSNTIGLNSVVAFHKIWFDANLAPVCRVGAPDCPNNVLEPASMALLGIGLAGLGAIRRRKQVA